MMEPKIELSINRTVETIEIMIELHKSRQNEDRKAELNKEQQKKRDKTIE